MRPAAALVLVVAAAAVAGGCGSSDDTTGGGGIAFGVLAPLSGPHAARAQDLLDGARLAADDLNVRGGVIGEPLTLVPVDDRCTAAGGEAAARKLAATESLAGVLGALCDPAAAAAARALGPEKIPFVVTSASSPSILSPARAPSTYLLSGTPYQEALAAAHWLALRGVQRLAIVAEDTPGSAFLAARLAALSVPVPALVSRQTVSPSGPDLAPVVKTALAASPDVVYWAGSAEGASRLVALLRRAGFKGVFLASARSESPAFVATSGAKAVEGAFVVAPATPQHLPGAAGWTRRFAAAFGHPPGHDALQAYDAVRVLAQAVTQTGEVDHALNTDQVADLDLEFMTLLGVVQFARDHTIQEDDRIILVVRKGRFRTETALRSNSG